MSLKPIVNNPNAKNDKSLNITTFSIDSGKMTCDELEVAGQPISGGGIAQSAGEPILIALDPQISDGTLGSGDAKYIKTGDCVQLFLNIAVTQLSAVSSFTIDFVPLFVPAGKTITISNIQGHGDLSGNLFLSSNTFYNTINGRLGVSFNSLGGVSNTGTGVTRSTITYFIVDI